MHEDFWEFAPTHKLILACNHKPVIRGTDHGIWRRIRLAPFNVVIPPEEQDKTLSAKLEAELPGILAWAVQGCLDWQQHGLGEPPEVREATASYRAEQDALAEFISQCCILDPDTYDRAAKLFAAYSSWSGDKSINRRRFGKAMTDRGFERFTNNGTCYRGIQLSEGDTE
jgi:putative DNA primase/helicase